jgi:hypothetical protein
MAAASQDHAKVSMMAVQDQQVMVLTLAGDDLGADPSKSGEEEQIRWMSFKVMTSHARPANELWMPHLSGGVFVGHDRERE